VGATALVLGFGNAVILNWPYTDTKMLREASELAGWLNHQSEKSSAATPSTVNAGQAGEPRLKLRKPNAPQPEEKIEC
jgi:hypothetical protein